MKARDLLFLALAAAFVGMVSCNGASDQITQEERGIVKALSDAEWDEARVCRLGAYTMIGVSDRESTLVALLRNGSPTVTVDNDNDAVIWDSSTSIVDLRDRDSDGTYDAISYEVRTVAGAKLRVWDSNLDGQLDMRRGTAADGTRVWEMRVRGQMRPVTKRDGRTVVMIDGAAVVVPTDEEGRLLFSEM
jgi:hypothetical protein